MVRRSLVRAVTLVLVVFAATFAAAQTGSGIAGVVKDETGAVLPGVTVEAASPALLERIRTVVTDEQGVYNFTIHRTVAASPNAPPWAAKLTAIVSLALWLGVVFGGVFIAFV